VREARRLALNMPDVHEEDHFGRPSFRVRGKIFATVPDEHHVNVMIDAFDVDAVVRMYPDACEQLWWGKKLSGVRVKLSSATLGMLRELMAAAWRRKAPRSLQV
jgi:hypothetical protein